MKISDIQCGETYEGHDGTKRRVTHSASTGGQGGHPHTFYYLSEDGKPHQLMASKFAAWANRKI